MFWNLYLAHLLGDFVFQTDWMVSKRDNLWVLTLHASIHFALMFLLVGQMRSLMWLILLFLALIHVIQDKLKNYVVKRRPDWSVPAFLIDQALHFVTIWTVMWWYQIQVGQFYTSEKPVWVIVAVTYLFVTYVWFISERVFNQSKTEYLKSINETKLPRMLTRAGLVSLFLLVRTWSLAGLAIVVPNPYPQSKFRGRALLTDISVSLLGMAFLFWELR